VKQVLERPELPSVSPKSDTRGTAASDTKAQVTALRLEGVGPREIARRLGVTPNTVAGHLWRAGMTAQRPVYAPKPSRTRPPRTPCPPLAGRQDVFVPKWGPEKVAEVRSLYQAGVTMTEISRRTGVPMGTLPIMWRDLPRRRKQDWSSAAKPRPFRLAVLVATFTGESQVKAAKRLGCSPHSIPNWMRDPDLVAEARAIADEVNARREVEREAERVAKLEAEAAEAARIAEINAPILAAITDERHRSMMMFRASGASLDFVGKNNGVTRERIRQIEIIYRLKGLIIPGAKPLSEASARLAYVPRGRSPGRPRKDGTPAVRKERPDFYSQAHAVIAGLKSPRPMRLSDEERQRRSDWGRELASRRHGRDASA
jgi:transposase-like protein